MIVDLSKVAISRAKGDGLQGCQLYGRIAGIIKVMNDMLKFFNILCYF